MGKAILAVSLVALMASTARAQPGEHLALGGGLGFHSYADGNFSSGKSPAIAPIYSIALRRSSSEGWSWAPKYGLGYANPERQDDVGGVAVTTGRLRMIPVMVGVGRHYQHGPVSLGFGVAAGPSFNRFVIDEAARTAYRDRLGQTLNSITANTSIATRPDLNVWYDFNRWLGLHGSADYTFNHPTARTTANGVATPTKWNADHMSYGVGLAVKVF